jgi:diguanylate cyclase (GGDEF)-like protein
MSGSSEANNHSGIHDETDTDRLRGILAHDALSVDLVSAFAGARPLTEAEEVSLSDLKESRGEIFFSDLLYAVTHQYFASAGAEHLWDAILRHKCEISKALNRNVQIVVAALDYFTTIKSDVSLPTLVNEAHIAEIVNLSMRDGLTGLFNHTSCYEILNLELKKYARHGTVVSLIVIDVDDFKAINDQLGHQAGDRVLKELGAMLKNTTRDADISCRYGGEEFAVIMPLTNARGAAEIAEKIRMEATQIQAGGCALTISLGVASCGEGTTTAHALIEKADRALYQAKKNGKNRVEMARGEGFHV